MSIALDFSGRVALVTGGTRGVGRGISTRFLEAGARVFVCGRSEPEAAELPASADGRRAHFIRADVRVPAQVDALLKEIHAHAGVLDVLVANAGGAPHANAADASHNFHQKVVELNLLAPLLCAQRANARMQQQGGGVVLFIGSTSAHRPSPGTAAYGAAKAGLRALAASLAVEWAPRVRVLVLSAGMVETEQAAQHFGGEAGLQAAAASIPLGRLATPQDLGNAAVFLASDLAAYASGTELLLHGGGEAPAFLKSIAQKGSQ